MIVIRVELHLPGAAPTLLAQGTIKTTEVSDDGTLADYRVNLSPANAPSEIECTALVRAFPRLAMGPWDLLLRCLLAAVGRPMPAFGDVRVGRRKP